MIRRIISLGIICYGTVWCTLTLCAQEVRLDTTVSDSAIIQRMDSVSFLDVEADSVAVASLDTTDKSKGFLKILFPPPRPPFYAEIAWKRSLLIPGWGQIYNKDYWKLPLVYGSYVGIFLVIRFNNQRYQEFRDAFEARNDDNPDNDFDIFPETVPDEGLRRARDGSRQDRDLSIIATVGIHLLQVIEAYVDAHLRGFDVSEDLTIELVPQVGYPYTNFQSFQPGLSLTYKVGSRKSTINQIY